MYRHKYLENEKMKNDIQETPLQQKKRGHISNLLRFTANEILRTVLPRDMYISRKLDLYKRRYSLPLNTIFTRIAIETRTDCNLKCEFCPQSTKPRPIKVMSESLYKRIVDELAEINFAGRICPLTNNEPLLDDRIVSFIAYARQKCPLSFLQLTTNGRLLSEELLLELFAAGLDYLIINDYRHDRKEQPFRLSKKLHRIAELERTMFRKKINIEFRSSLGTLGSRAGNIPEKGLATLYNQFCALPFTGMWVQPEGKTILCCQDYNHDEIMGDVRENSLSEIWFNDKYKRIRAELYKGDRSGKICSKCDYSGIPLPGERHAIKLK